MTNNKFGEPLELDFCADEAELCTGDLKFQAYWVHEGMEEFDEPTAQRIVASYNACLGMDDPAKEIRELHGTCAVRIGMIQSLRSELKRVRKSLAISQEIAEQLDESNGELSALAEELGRLYASQY